ncbi:GTPase [Nostoc sp.]
MTDPTTTTDETLDYSFLLVTHMVCADQQIHNKELKYLYALNSTTKLGRRTKEEKEKILIQDENLIPVDFVAQKVLSEQQNWAMGQILVMAYVDGFYSPLEHQMVEQVAEIWGWSNKRLQEFVKYAKLENAVQPIKEDSTARNTLWNTQNYKAAIEQCTKIAQQDFKFTESALQAAKTTLDNLKIDIDIELNRLTIEHKSSGNARAQTAQEVTKQLETTKQSLEVEIVKKIQDVRESLNGKQRALNYFSIAFMGKTKAGKSTLHAIMTGEGWDSIGVGKQRTTRLNRVYELENIRIIDTPGIGAPGGKTDEEIAQSVIHEADVICYVVTNDSIQETEFGFLRLLKENAKPLIVLLNVHKNFRDSRRGPYELDKFLKNPDKLFALDGTSGLGGHIERIRRYAQQHYGNDYFDIVPVMLLAAQLSYEREHQDNQEQLFKTSQIKNFIDEIWLSIVKYGNIRRSQTLLGCTAVELEKPYKWIEQQAETFTNSTDRLKSKHRNIDKQIAQAANDARNSLKNEIESIFKDALNAIPSFAETHWDSSESEMKQEWETKLKNIGFEERLSTAYQETVSHFAKEVQESLEEIGRELQLIGKLGSHIFSFNRQNSSDERNFFRIGGGILGLAGVVMAFIPPLAGIGLIVGIVGGVIGFIGGFLKSKQEKRREAVENISSVLQRQIKEFKHNSLLKALEQLDKTCDEVQVNVDKYFKELIEGLDAIAINLNLAQSELLEKSVDVLNRAYAKRLVDWCCKKYEPLTQDSIDAAIAQVTRNSTDGINIATKTTIEIKIDSDEIRRILQESVTFEKQPKATSKTHYQIGDIVMEPIFKSVLNFFIQDDWNYTEIEPGEALRLEVKMENSNYTCYAIVNEKNKTFLFYSNSPVKIPKNQYLQIAEFLTRANYGLNIGNFEMDFRDGEVRYKTSIFLGDNELDYPVIRRIVYSNLSTIDDYFPAIMKVIYGGMSAEEAVNQIEGEEEDQEAA